MIAPLVLLAVSLTSVTGQWHSSVTLGSMVLEVTFDLTQAGQSITGTVTARDQVWQIRDGSIQGDRISFSTLVPAGGRLVASRVTGTIVGAELHVNLDGAPLVATRVQPSAAAIRAERLAGLMRLWGAIKFFHPYVAQGLADWEAALIAAIPKVEAAGATEAYAAAIDAMLGALKDPETHVVVGAAAPAPLGGGTLRRLIRSGVPPGADYFTDWEPADSGAPYVIQLPERVRVAVRTAEPAEPSNGIAALESDYGDSLPSREQRLLALARFWNAIHYFYGYPSNLVNWDRVLPEFIPIFESATTRRDYILAVSQLAAKTNDSHSQVPAIWQEFGYWPEVAVSPIEGRSVVTAVGSSAKGIERGDIVIAVDGELVEHRLDFLLRLYPHSTTQAGLLMTHRLLLAGTAPTVQLRIEKSNGRQEEVTLPRDAGFDWERTDRLFPTIKKSTPVFGVLPDGSGYMDLDRLLPQDVNRAFETVMNAPALILDMRGLSQVMDEVAARLTDTKTVDALVRRRVWHGPDPAATELQTTEQHLYPSALPKYKGRVVALIDAHAFSRSEHVCLFLETAAQVTFIGSPTQGADGDITSMILPGGIRVNFAGQEIRHADGRVLQGVGILPDIWAAPTIAGFREGRDEVLEKAIQVLKAREPVRH